MGSRALELLVCSAVGICIALGSANAQSPPAASTCREPAGGTVTITPQIGHFITHLVVSGSEDVAVSSDQSGTLKVWALEPRSGVGPIIRTIAAGDRIWDLAISSDGRRVATAHDNAVCIWDLESGRPVFELRDKDRPMNRVRSLVFTNEDRWLLTAGDDGGLRIWSATAGKLERVLHRHKEPITKLALSPSGKLLAAGAEDGRLTLWSLPDGAQLWSVLTAPEPVHALSISEAAGVVASGGGVLFVKPGKDTLVRLWDLKNGQLAAQLPPTMSREESDAYNVSALTLALDGERLYVEDPTGVSTWSMTERRFLKKAQLQRSFTLLTYSRSYLIQYGSQEDYDLRGIIQVPLDGQKEARRFRVGAEWGRDVLVSPDGQHAVSLSTGALCLWNLGSGQRKACRRLDYARTLFAGGKAAFTADGKQLFLHLERGEVEAMDAQNLSSLWTRSYEREGDTYYPVQELCVTSDGTRIVAAASDRTMRIFDAADGTVLRTVGADDRRLIGAWISPDGTSARRILQTEGPSGEIGAAWLSALDLRTGRETSSLAMTGEKAVLFAWFIPTSGDVLTFELPRGTDSRTGDLVLRDGVTGEPRRLIDRVSGSVSTVAFTPDGRYVAAGMDEQGYAIKIWDLVTGRRPIVLKGHDDRISAVAFAPDGKRLVSTASDGVKIWSLQRQTLAATLYTSAGEDWVAMTPAGFFAAGGRSENLISVARGLDTYPVQHFFETLYRPDLVGEELTDDRQAKHAKAAAALSLDKILTSGPAPLLELLEDSTEHLPSAVRVRARIKDEGGGIGPKVIWRVNGQVRAVDDVPGVQEGGVDAVVIEQLLRVVPGTTHMVEVLAYNRAGLLASLPLTFPVTVEGAASRETRLHVLAVGITEYAKKDWRLPLAASDAKTIADALQVAAQGLFSRVKTTLLINEQATAQGIGAAFAKIASDPDVQPNDVFVFYVAGHGQYDGARYFLVPQDLDTGDPPTGKGQSVPVDAINQETLQRWIGSVQVDKRLVILDTCESAQGGGAVIRSLASPRLSAMEQLQHATGDNLLAAAGQAAFESSKLGHGLLTYAVLEAFARRQDSPEDEKVTTDTVAIHAGERVPVLSREIFGQEQWPIRKMSSGVPIPLGFRRLGLPLADVPDPIRRNFILMRDELVRTKPDSAAATDPPMRLEAPMIVQILGYNEASDWVRIQWGDAVDGKGVGVGWVPTAAVREPKRAPRQ